MKPNSSLAKVQTFLHIQNLPNKKLVRQVLFYGSGGRTYVLSHIYNPPKPSFDKEGLWQDFVLHCSAIAYTRPSVCAFFIRYRLYGFAV